MVGFGGALATVPEEGSHESVDSVGCLPRVVWWSSLLPAHRWMRKNVPRPRRSLVQRQPRHLRPMKFVWPRAALCHRLRGPIGMACLPRATRAACMRWCNCTRLPIWMRRLRSPRPALRSGQPLTGNAYLALVRSNLDRRAAILANVRWADVYRADDKLSPSLKREAALKLGAPDPRPHRTGRHLVRR